MIKDFAIIVSSCEKFSDLWKTHFDLFFKNWIGDKPKIYLITDKETSFEYDGVIIKNYDGEMPTRLLKACEEIEENYFLLTLDDYFLIDKANEDNFIFFYNYVRNNKIDYLRIYDRRFTKKKYFTKIEDIFPIDLNTKYTVCLYPAIWNKNFLVNCIDEDETPWKFESSLNKKAILQNAKCYYNNSGSFNILDVVRKGKILHKANSYFKKNKIKIGDRPIVSYKVEIRQIVADFIWWHMPKIIYKVCRRIAAKLGMKFYSEE